MILFGLNFLGAAFGNFRINSRDSGFTDAMLEQLQFNLYQLDRIYSSYDDNQKCKFLTDRFEERYGGGWGCYMGPSGTSHRLTTRQQSEIWFWYKFADKAYEQQTLLVRQQ